MNARRAFRVLLAVVGVVAFGYPTRASSRDVLFPFQGGYAIGDSNSLAFVSNGRLGFALLVGSDNVETRLFSFSTEDSSIMDSSDITPDLKADSGTQIFPRVSIKVDDRASLVLVYGTDTGLRERVIGFAFDQAGHLNRLWAITYGDPQVLSGGTELALSGDGSRIFLVYSRSAEATSTYKIDSLDPSSGVILATANLTSAHFRARAALFDDIRNRVVTLCDAAVLALKAGIRELEVESETDYQGSQATNFFPLGLSQSGRFLLAYASFTRPTGADDGANVYIVYDLDTRQSRESRFDSALFPAANQIAFNAVSGTAIDAPTAEYQHSDGGLQLILKPRRSLEIYSLGADGALTRTFDFQIPKPDGGIFSGPVLSRSGALGLVPTVTGRLLSFDTLTGELIGNQLIGGNAATVIQLVESQQLLSFTDGTNKLTLVDMKTGPAIDGVKVRGSSTTITGTNFLAGARVQINGVDIGGATRSPDDPGHVITIGRGKRDFPPGQSFSIAIVNRDGLASEPFVLTR